MPADSTPKLDIQVAEMRATFGTKLDNITDDLKNIAQAITALATRREVESTDAHRVKELADLAKRVEALEGVFRRLAWAVASAWLAGLGVVLNFVGAH